jgi:hypothetical protein
VVAELTRQVRETIRLTPEPRYSWALGGCDLPAYAEYCSRIGAIRDQSALDSWATDVVTRASSPGRRHPGVGALSRGARRGDP